MRIGKNKNIMIEKKQLIRILSLSLAGLFVLIFLIDGMISGFDPKDRYVVLRTDAITAAPVAGQKADFFSAAGEAPLAQNGMAMYDGYIPKGCTLYRVEHIFTEDDGTAENGAFKFLYRHKDYKSNDRFFFVLASVGDKIKIETNGLNYESMLDPTYREYSYATFGDFDLYVCKVSSADILFAKFRCGGREWIVHCENMNKRELRLIVSSILEQYAAG